MLNQNHAMQRAATLFGTEGRARIAAACIVAVATFESAGRAARAPQWLADRSAQYFRCIVEAFTPTDDNERATDAD